MCIGLTSCVYDPIVSDWMERKQEMMPPYAYTHAEKQL
jgi:hypothetical protein